MNADDRFTVLAHGIEAGIAQLQGQLIFALCSETPVTLVTSGKIQAIMQFANMNFGMNF